MKLGFTLINNILNITSKRLTTRSKAQWAQNIVIFDAGHFGWSIGEFVRENLDWLDKYLGSIDESASEEETVQAISSEPTASATQVSNLKQ